METKCERANRSEQGWKKSTAADQPLLIHLERKETQVQM